MTGFVRMTTPAGVNGSGRTLHVVTPPEPGRGGVAAGELLYAALAGAGAGPDRTLILGTSTDRFAAVRLGVRDPWLSPISHTGVAISPLLVRAARAGEAETVVLWSRELLVAAPGLRRGGFRVEARLLDAPGLDEADSWRPGVRALDALDGLFVPDVLSRDCWVEAGVDPGRIEIARFSLPRLGVDRDGIRALLDVGEAPVFAPLSADPRRVDARALAFVSGVLELLGREHVLIVPEGCERFAEGVRFRRRAGLVTRYVVVKPPLLGVLPAADALIAPCVESDRSPVGVMLNTIASDLGLPVASIAGWNVQQGLGHGMLAPDIRQNVGPVIDAFEIASGASG